MSACDFCGQDVHRDRNGWWVGPDETSDCPDSATGHAVNGAIR